MSRTQECIAVYSPPEHRRQSSFARDFYQPYVPPESSRQSSFVRSFLQSGSHHPALRHLESRRIIASEGKDERKSKIEDLQLVGNHTYIRCQPSRDPARRLRNSRASPEDNIYPTRQRNSAGELHNSPGVLLSVPEKISDRQSSWYEDALQQGMTVEELQILLEDSQAAQSVVSPTSMTRQQTWVHDALLQTGMTVEGLQSWLGDDPSVSSSASTPRHATSSTKPSKNDKNKKTNSKKHGKKSVTRPKVPVIFEETSTEMRTEMSTELSELQALEHCRLMALHEANIL